MVPKTGRGAVAYVAFVSMAISLISWTISLIFSGLLVQAIARRQELRMDYRAGGAAGYMGIGATWALGISSAAAQIQANPASLPSSSRTAVIVTCAQNEVPSLRIRKPSSS